MHFASQRFGGWLTPGWHPQPREGRAAAIGTRPSAAAAVAMATWVARTTPGASQRLMLPNTAAAARANTLVHPRFRSLPPLFHTLIHKNLVFFILLPPPSPGYIQVNFNNQEELKYLSYSFPYTAIKAPGIQPDKQTQEVRPKMLIFFTGGLHSFHNN